MRKWSCILLNKSQLRKTLRIQRDAIEPSTSEMAAVSAAKILLSHPLFHASHSIACYLARDAEFNTMPIIKTIWQANKQCYLPVLTKDQDKPLHFFKFKAGDALLANRYDIMEPSTLNSQAYPAENLDVVLLPLLAFDREGHRLGTGGGYYDRTFAFLSSVERPNKPLLIGLGYAMQEMQVLLADKWDVGLDGALTEKELVLF